MCLPKTNVNARSLLIVLLFVCGLSVQAHGLTIADSNVAHNVIVVDIEATTGIIENTKIKLLYYKYCLTVQKKTDSL